MRGTTVLIVGSGRAVEDCRRELHRFGYGAEHYADPEVALERLVKSGFDLVVVGTGLPRERLRLCAAIRERMGRLPILLIGAAPCECEAIGAPLGPDDYVVREFDSEEIRTRARVLLHHAVRDATRNRVEALHASGPLRLQPETRRVSFEGRSVDLTAIEYQLLSYLARAPGRVFSREELLHEVWGYAHTGYGHTLTTHVNRLRAKLERYLGAPRLVETVRGLGYRFSDAISRS